MMQFTSEIAVRLIQSVGGDSMVVAAAKVSTTGKEAISFVDKEANKGLINFLIKRRHGTPFEHASLTFFVHGPIFLWREWHRHRIGFSYNEESARYKQLEPIFWIPRPERKMISVPDPGDTCLSCSKILEKIENGLKICRFCQRKYEYHHSARPRFEKANQSDYKGIIGSLMVNYRLSYTTYENLLKIGVAKEVARACLPVAIYSACWVTCNPRSLMSFLSLRTHDDSAKFVSYPQAEIEEAARVCEQVFKEGWPITYDCWDKNGRIAP